MARKVSFKVSAFSYASKKYRSTDARIFKSVIFDKLSDYNSFVDTILQTSSNPNVRILRDAILKNKIPQMERHGTTDPSELKGEKVRFLGKDVIDPALEKFKSSSDNKRVLSFDDKKKLRFNDRELGIFSFDLAAAGLSRVKEYYSPLFERVVDANDVESVNQGMGKIAYFYTADPYHEVIQRDAISENGLPKVKTSIKKVFIDIPKPKKTLPQIDIFINAAFSWKIDYDSLFWNAFSVSAICDKLNESGVSTRIWMVNGVETKKPYGFYNFVKIKDFNDPLDVHSLSIAVADARFFRFDLFKAFMAFPDYFSLGSLVPTNLGYPITSEYDLRQDIFNTLYNLELFDLPDEKILFQETKIVLPPVTSERDAINLYNSTLNDLERVAEKHTNGGGLTKWAIDTQSPEPIFDKKDSGKFSIDVLDKEKITYLQK